MRVPAVLLVGLLGAGCGSAAAPVTAPPALTAAPLRRPFASIDAYCAAVLAEVVALQFELYWHGREDDAEAVYRQVALCGLRDDRPSRARRPAFA